MKKANIKDYSEWIRSECECSFFMRVPLLKRLGMAGGERKFESTPREAVERALNANGGGAELFVFHGSWEKVDLKKSYDALDRLEEEEEEEDEFWQEYREKMEKPFKFPLVEESQNYTTYKGIPIRYAIEYDHGVVLLSSATEIDWMKERMEKEGENPKIVSIEY